MGEQQREAYIPVFMKGQISLELLSWTSMKETEISVFAIVWGLLWHTVNLILTNTLAWGFRIQGL